MLRAFSLAAAVLFAAPASAGVVITLDDSGGPDGGKHQLQVLSETDRLKLPRPNGGMIYRADQDKAYNYDDQRKAYTEITRQSLGEMRSQMDAALARARAQIATLPPEQRKLAEEMLSRHGGGQPGQPPAAPTVSYEKSGGRQTLGKWSCENAARLEDGRKVADLCIARLDDLGLTRQDLKAFVGLSDMMKPVAGPGRAGSDLFDFDAMAKALGYEGLPIRTTRTLPDGRVHQTTITGIERKTIAAAEFELPAGYTNRELPHQ